MAYGSFRSHVVTPAALAVQLRAAMDFADAAVVPIAYLTAASRCSASDRSPRAQRVLIDAATGGVGLWAVQLACACGRRGLRDGRIPAEPRRAAFDGGVACLRLPHARVL